MDHFITQLLLTYQFPAIFFGSFFFGETVIITAAFLAGQGLWSLTTVFWLSFFGTVLADTAWFLFGQSLFKKTKRWDTENKKYQRFLRTLERITGQRPFLSLLFIKFLYGTRVLTIMYLSVRKIHLWQFILFDTIGTFLWLIVMLSIGWLAGKGVANVLDIFNNIEYTLVALVVIILLYRTISVWIEKRIVKK